jgi:ATP-dependent Lon protease
MTGEVTLRGRVLAIGGLKEKLLAALRSGIKTVLIPSENEKDLADIPENVKSGLKIIPVSTVDEVLIHALVRELEPIEWTDPAEDAALPAAGTRWPTRQRGGPLHHALISRDGEKAARGLSSRAALLLTAASRFA